MYPPPTRVIAPALIVQLTVEQGSVSCLLRNVCFPGTHGVERAQRAARSPLRRAKQSIFSACGPRFGPSRLPLPPPFFLPSFLHKKVHRISQAIMEFSVHTQHKTHLHLRSHHPSQGHRHTPWGDVHGVTVHTSSVSLSAQGEMLTHFANCILSALEPSRVWRSMQQILR